MFEIYFKVKKISIEIFITHVIQKDSLPNKIYKKFINNAF